MEVLVTAPALPTARRCPYAPPEEHTKLRETERIARVTLFNGREAWAVTRHEDVRAMLADTRFSSDRRNPDFPLNPDRKPLANPDFRPAMITMDPPEHGPARRSVISEFTVRRMASLRPRIQEITDGLIDELLSGPRPADLVRALSLPVPSMVICEQLGVPYADRDVFQSRTSRMIKRDVDREKRAQAGREIRDYLRELIQDKVRTPADDLIGRQLAGGADPEDLISLSFLLLVAGHETTANMISLGTVALLDHPDQLAALRADPSKMPAAVEELLRVFTIAEFANARVATEDIEFCGVTVRKGDGIVALSNAANHDPAMFEDPDEVRIDRNARHHVAFGYGVHQCLGQNLARMELQIVFETLFRRVPSLRLAAEAGELPYKDDAFIYGLHSLPVTW
jgi:cytochrome P450